MCYQEVAGVETRAGMYNSAFSSTVAEGKFSFVRQRGRKIEIFWETLLMSLLDHNKVPYTIKILIRIRLESLRLSAAGL